MEYNLKNKKRKYSCSTNHKRSGRSSSVLGSRLTLGCVTGSARSSGQSAFTMNHRANRAGSHLLQGPQKVLLKSINPLHRRVSGDNDGLGVGWKKCDQQLYLVCVSSGSGTHRFSEAQTKKLRKLNSFRG